MAEIPFSIKFLPDYILPLCKKTLQGFEVRTSSEHASDLIIEFIADCPDSKTYKERLVTPAAEAHMVIVGDLYLFTFPTGQFLANRDFSRILLWSPYEKTLGGDLDGYPWLQLILWGRVSLMGGCYLHGALIVIDGHYILLLGDSGTGKSTLSGLAVQEGFTRLTEENPFLTWQDKRPTAHAAPWLGMSGPPAISSGSLSCIFFLRHAPKNDIQRLTPQEAGRRLITNARMFNWLPQTIPGTVEVLNNTLSQVPVYDFGFVPDPSAVRAIRHQL